jgi:hypothetical protein
MRTETKMNVDGIEIAGLKERVFSLEERMERLDKKQ